MRDTAELIFNTSLGETHTVRVPDPIPAISAPQVTAAADHFIAANPFNETVGDLLSLLRADRVRVSRRILLPE